LDIVVAIGATGNHVASVYNREALVATGAFTQASLYEHSIDARFRPDGRELRVVGNRHDGGLLDDRRPHRLRLPNAAGSNAGWTGAYTATSARAVNNDTTSTRRRPPALRSTYNVGDITVPAGTCDPLRVAVDEGQERRLLAGQHQGCLP
jgi:hypothetical protein